METTGIKYLLKQIICWALLLQMIHVSMESVNPLDFTDKGAVFEKTSSHSQKDNLFEWLFRAFSNHHSYHHQDIPVGESEESTFLEEFSVCLIWPLPDMEFCNMLNDEGLTDNFGQYLENFIPHYSEPHSPPPNQA